MSAYGVKLYRFALYLLVINTKVKKHVLKKVMVIAIGIPIVFHLKIVKVFKEIQPKCATISIMTALGNQDPIVSLINVRSTIQLITHLVVIRMDHHAKIIRHVHSITLHIIAIPTLVNGLILTILAIK